MVTWIAAHPDEKIVRGTGWNRAWFNGSNGQNRVPTRHDLDRVCKDKPVVLESYCKHNIWVNSKALELAGVTKDTPTPDTGVIRRESDGTPEGIFEEAAAIELIKTGLPGYDYSVSEYKEVILKYQKELANYYGLTLACDVFHTDNARDAYRELAAEGKLTLRMRGVYTLDNSAPESDWQNALGRKGKDDVGDMFRIETVKMFMEGEPCMIEPYSPETNRAAGKPEDYRGKIFWEQEEGTEYMIKAIEAGFQLHLHAMGDQTIKTSIDCLEEAQKHSRSAGRNVIAHLMAVRAEDKQRMGKLGIMGSCQPRWMVYDTDVEDFYRPCFGDGRALRFYPNKSLQSAGCRIAYGTDFPVTPPPDPFHEIHCAMTRSLIPGAPDYDRFADKVLSEDECVSLTDAIAALTINGAYQCFLEDVTGSIEKGKSADLVILDCDIESIPVGELYKIKADKTIFMGNIVFSRG